MFSPFDSDSTIAGHYVISRTTTVVVLKSMRAKALDRTGPTATSVLRHRPKHRKCAECLAEPATPTLCSIRRMDHREKRAVAVQRRAALQNDPAFMAQLRQQMKTNFMHVLVLVGSIAILTAIMWQVL
jgi:hypothetical protein